VSGVVAYGLRDGQITPTMVTELPFLWPSSWNAARRGNHTACSAGVPLFTREESTMTFAMITQEEGVGEVSQIPTVEPPGSGFAWSSVMYEGFDGSVALIDEPMAMSSDPDPHYTLRFFDPVIKTVLLPGQQTARGFFR